LDLGGAIPPPTITAIQDEKRQVYSKLDKALKGKEEIEEGGGKRPG